MVEEEVDEEEEEVGGRERQDDGCIRIICNRNLQWSTRVGRRPLGAAVFRALQYLDGLANIKLN